MRRGQFDQVLKRLLNIVNKGPMYVLLEKNLTSLTYICETIAMCLWLFADETSFSDQIKEDIQILKQQLSYVHGPPGRFIFDKRT